MRDKLIISMKFIGPGGVAELASAFLYPVYLATELVLLLLRPFTSIIQRAKLRSTLNLIFWIAYVGVSIYTVKNFKGFAYVTGNVFWLLFGATIIALIMLRIGKVVLPIVHYYQVEFTDGAKTEESIIAFWDKPVSAPFATTFVAVLMLNYLARLLIWKLGYMF